MKKTTYKSFAGFLALSLASVCACLAPSMGLAAQKSHPGFGKRTQVTQAAHRSDSRTGLRARPLVRLKPNKKVTTCKESYTEFKCTTEYLY
jgi:hypothetical protein